jgi:hypothetical protein
MNMRAPIIGFGLAILASQFGTPHILARWRCQAFGGACVHYDSCVYVGVRGEKNYLPPFGPHENCPFILFPLFETELPSNLAVPRLVIGAPQ